MEPHHIHLEDFPWPVSVLKFNQAIDAMLPGDDMLATFKDPDVVGNAKQLLCSKPNMIFNVIRTDKNFCIRIHKG